MEDMIESKRQEVEKYESILGFLKASDPGSATALLSRIREGHDVDAVARAVEKETYAAQNGVSPKNKP
ncbi:hypothetical protein HIM_10601 [Hirsutella minnesotensis 3608]|uniref:Uncharacterized protein n=1 Tax=Hirsutella minnesotensis 3608 TaxID=1043627 RepID=A0A0F7ZJW6_9HYPO|nr:hypothetical protein HIM_10601 [Hirsutella minnesotensis 3608]